MPASSSVPECSRALRCLLLLSRAVPHSPSHLLPRRLAGLLRNLSAYYYKEPTLLFLVRVAQGLVHAGKGLLTATPYHSDRMLLSGESGMPFCTPRGSRPWLPREPPAPGPPRRASGQCGSQRSARCGCLTAAGLLGANTPAPANRVRP